MNVADRIKRLRELFGITANEFAKITGIHPVSIRKYETNKMIPGIDVIDKMCEALKLPRMIFEGFPKQHTDYQFTGDFYQQLFLLLDNQTILPNSEGENNAEAFSLNQNLSRYITLKHDGKEIPISELSIEIKYDDYKTRECYNWFRMYLQYLDIVQKTSLKKRWTDSKETKEEYIARILENAERQRFDLMLADHNWKQYMEGWESSDVARSAVEQEIINGGNYYTYVEKLDAPESEKEKLIHAYEDAFIDEMIHMDSEYPGGKSPEEKEAWIEKKIELFDKYKIDHPDYPELAKQHAIENANEARANITKK